MAPNSDFLLIGAGTLAPKGFMKAASFGKAPLFAGADYERRASTRLWNLESAGPFQEQGV